jgi:hypothetical protein
LVLSAPENDPEAKPEPKSVVQIYHNKPQPILEIHVNGDVIRTTHNHPFYVCGKGFIHASELEKKDQLRKHDGQWVEILHAIKTNKVEQVFNLQIDNYHTYFVGCLKFQTWILVHNDSKEEWQESSKWWWGNPWAYPGLRHIINYYAGVYDQADRSKEIEVQRFATDPNRILSAGDRLGCWIEWKNGR